MLLLLITIFSLQLLPGSETTRRSEISVDVEVKGVRDQKGALRLALFDSEQNWLKTPLRSHIMDADSSVCSWHLDSLETGRYALAVFHDLNLNGKNDANLLGIPREPWAVSNGKRRRFGAPTWEASQFTIERDTTITVWVR